MTPRERFGAYVLALAGVSAGSAEFVKWTEDEGFVESAMVPTKGDRPTIGFGSTYWENGRPVRMGERITRERATALALHGLNRDQMAVAKTIPDVQVTRKELAIYTNFVGQFGIDNWMGSTSRKALLQGNHLAACHGLLLYKYSAGYDCSIPGNKICGGVWTRQLKRHADCLEENSDG